MTMNPPHFTGVDPHTGPHHALAFLESVTAAGGTVPDQLRAILGVADQLKATADAADPLGTLIDDLASGSLTPSQLNTRLAKAAQAEQVNAYRANLRPKVEHAVVKRFAVALDAGAAQEILDSVKPVVAEHAAALAAAAELIGDISSADDLLYNGSPEQIAAWTSVDGHIAAFGRIVNVLNEIGPGGTFSLVSNPTQFGTETNGRYFNSAGLFLTPVTVPTATAGEHFMFHNRIARHRNSVYYQLAGVIELQNLATVRERVRQYAEDLWQAANTDHLHHTIVDGKAVQRVTQNPYVTN